MSHKFVAPTVSTLAALLGFTGCNAEPAGPGAQVGNLHLEARTEGPLPQFGRYVVTLRMGTIAAPGELLAYQEPSVDANGEAVFVGVPAGPIIVELKAAEVGCRVRGANPRSVTIEGADNPKVQFRVVCGS